MRKIKRNLFVGFVVYCVICIFKLFAIIKPVFIAGVVICVAAYIAKPQHRDNFGISDVVKSLIPFYNIKWGLKLINSESKTPVSTEEKQ